MSANERTFLLRPHENGVNGWQKLEKPLKHIIQMPKVPCFEFEFLSGALSLAELLPYQDDPWWQKLRNTIFYSFWFVMLLTFLSACALAFMHSGTSCKVMSSLSNSSNIIISTLPTTRLTSEVSEKLAVLAS